MKKQFARERMMDEGKELKHRLEELEHRHREVQYVEMSSLNEKHAMSMLKSLPQ